MLIGELNSEAVAAPTDAVHVDVSIELRDLWRAYLDTSRVTIAVAACVALSAVLAVVSCFIMIGEYEILLQTSPLFVGLPVLGVVGQVMHVHAALRKGLAGLSEDEKTAQYMFQPGADGYDVVWGDSYCRVGWRDVSRVIERADYFQFYYGKADYRVVPKRGFHRTADVGRLREILRDRLQERARLLSA